MPTTRPESTGDRRDRRERRRRSDWRAGLWLLWLPVLPALLMLWLHPRAPDWAGLRDGIVQIALADVAQGDAVLWVDARSAEHFEAGHIPGAINLSEDHWDAQLSGFIDQWTPDRRVIVYCDGEACLASRQVALRLRRELQIDNVAVLTSGWPAWLEAHEPIER